MDDLKKQDYIRLKNDLLSIRNLIDSLNKDYVTLTSYLERGLKIDNRIIEKEKWDMIGNRQKEVLTDINQVVLPYIEKNII